MVEILARFRGTSGAESAAGSTGLRVRIGSGYLGYPQKFLATQKKFPVYGMGEEIPAGALEGGWAITLEEQIPADGVEEEEPSEPFYIIVERNGKREVYTQCRWESVSREFTAGGIRKIRTGMAKIRTTMEV